MYFVAVCCPGFCPTLGMAGHFEESDRTSEDDNGKRITKNDVQLYIRAWRSVYVLSCG